MLQMILAREQQQRLLRFLSHARLWCAWGQRLVE